MFGLLNSHKPRQPRLDPTKWADKFEPCKMCGGQKFEAYDGPRLLVRRRYYYVVQGHTCLTCGLVARLGRRLDEETWSPDMGDPLR